MFSIHNLRLYLSNKKLLFLFYFIIVLLIYFPTLNIAPFGDDRVEVFNNWLILTNSNPFSYWNILGENYKTWSLSYTVLFLVNSIAGHKYFIYRILNLLIHTINSVLILNISKKLKFSYRLQFTISLFFLIHPLAVESIVWIFQIKTLLATLFFLICSSSFIDYLQNNIRRDYLLSLFSFFLSTVSKSSFVFLPFGVLFFSKSLKQQFKKTLLIPFILVSMFSIIMTVHGVGSSVGELNKITTYQHDLINAANIDSYGRMENSLQRLRITISSYLFSNFDFNIITKKISLIGLNSFSYLSSFLGIWNFWHVYNDHDYQNIFSFFKLSFIFILMYFILRSKLKNWLIILISILLPVSGLFYVPYFKFSPISDHYIYSSLPLLCLFLVYLINQITVDKIKKIISAAFSLIFSFHTLIYIFNYSNPEKFFEKNISYNPEALILYEYIAEMNKENSPTKALEFSSLALQFAPERLDLLKFQQYIHNKNKNYHEIHQLNLKIIDIYMANNDFNNALKQLHLAYKTRPFEFNTLLPYISTLIVLNYDNSSIEEEYEKFFK